jgi:hypothetical protein
MSDSAFWRDLVTRFRELQKEQRGDGLRAEWDDIDHQWHLRSEPNASILRRFEQAAEYAVRRLGMQPDTKAKRHGASARNTWLNLLRSETNAFRVTGDSVEKIEGKSAKTIASAKKIAALWGRRPGTWRGINGVIARVCEVSADYCEYLADQAEEAERKLRSEAAPSQGEETSPPVEKDAGISPTPAHEKQGKQIPPSPKAEIPAATKRLIRGERNPNVSARRTELRNILRSVEWSDLKDKYKTVCARWDSHNIKLPEPWYKQGVTTWMEALGNRRLRPNVKKLISTDIRRI